MKPAFCDSTSSSCPPCSGIHCSEREPREQDRAGRIPVTWFIVAIKMSVGVARSNDSLKNRGKVRKVRNVKMMLRNAVNRTTDKKGELEKGSRKGRR